MIGAGAHPRGRYAPSPTGRLHAGNARTALIAWLAARAEGGTFVMRSEDLDRARISPDAEAALWDDLAWLGLDWDEGPQQHGPSDPYRQSERTQRYHDALEELLRSGRAFPCACSRAEVARAASAPHAEDDEGPRYPGTCRGLDPAEVEARARVQGRGLAIRFDGRREEISFEDEVCGTIAPLGIAGVDDFVLRRADGVAAYQLAVVVDDAAMGIDLVVRGQDLLASTPRQLALYRALSLRPPRFAHVPLLLAPGGERLAKRTRPSTIADLRTAGIPARVVTGRLAASAGLCASGLAAAPREILATIAGEPDLWRRLTREPAIWDANLDRPVR